jgi:hypothetical protein
MFDFNDLNDDLQFGRLFEEGGEKWQVIKTLPNRYRLAVKANDSPPCICYVVREAVQEEKYNGRD